MIENARDFCVSCGVARSHGDTCDYCGRQYHDSTKSGPQVTRHTALSNKYKISKNRDKRVITWSWGGRRAWFLIPFGIIWIAMTWPIAKEFLGEPLGNLPIPLMFPLIGVALILYAILNMVNKTSIHASPRSLYLTHHPIPWRGKLKVDARNIEQVFVSRTQRSSKQTSWHAPALQLITKDGQRHQLLRGKSEAEFTDYESLRYILLNALDIEPQTVAGAHDSFG